MMCVCFGGPCDGKEYEVSEKSRSLRIPIIAGWMQYADGSSAGPHFGELLYERSGDVLLFVSGPDQPAVA